MITFLSHNNKKMLVCRQKYNGNHFCFVCDALKTCFGDILENIFHLRHAILPVELINLIL